MPTSTKFNPFAPHIVLLVFVVIGIIFIVGLILVVDSFPCEAPSPVTTHSASVSALWKKSGFYIASSDQSGLRIVALNNVVVVSTNCHKVIAFDGKTGKELWTSKIGYMEGLVISPTTVFISHGETITARDVKTGKYLWDTRSLHGSGTTILHIQGDILYAGNNYGYELLDVRTGRSSNWGLFGDGKFPPSEVFPARELQSANLLFGVDAVFGKTAYLGGSAWDIPSGNKLWVSNVPLISPIAATQTAIYALSVNGELLRFEPATGAANVKIYFTPAPLAHFIQNDGADYNNFVAIDPSSSVAYVYLGDSQTLAAYPLNP